MTDDKKIWDDFRNGKSYALSHIYYQQVQLLFRYGKKFCNDDEIIKDAIQDLFFDLIRTRARLGETDNIQFYLFRSFRRKLVKNLKIQNVEEVHSKHVLEAEIVYSAEQEIIRKEELTRREEMLQKGLSQLSPKQREILYYKFTCDFDYDQICELMQIKYDSARKQVFRAMKALKEVLTDNPIILFFLQIVSKKQSFYKK